jgi:hypothetical protein
MAAVAGGAGLRMSRLLCRAKRAPIRPEFRSVDQFGRRRFTELSLFEISGANDAYVFDRSDIENDPVANRLLPEWKRKCQAGVGVITSEPGL